MRNSQTVSTRRGACSYRCDYPPSESRTALNSPRGKEAPSFKQRAQPYVHVLRCRHIGDSHYPLRLASQPLGRSDAHEDVGPLFVLLSLLSLL